MRKGKKETKEEKVTLLQELCGADVELYACLTTMLYENPLAAISPKGLDILIGEAEKSGNFRLALDKAIFEGARNPDERERCIRVIQDLVSKAIGAAEQEREAAEKEGLSDRAAFLRRAIENQKVMRGRAGDILRVASKYYDEKLTELGESARREERGKDREKAAREEKRIGDQEKTGREAREQARRGMGREERREAEKQERREAEAAGGRREARGEERSEAEREEKRIGEQEETKREARREERRGK